jgi:hypothetical protein
MRQKAGFAALMALAFGGTAQVQAGAQEGGTGCKLKVAKLRELSAKRRATLRPTPSRENARAAGIAGIYRRRAGVATPHCDGPMAGTLTMQSVINALVKV